VSPPEILAGGFPATEQWIVPQQEAREAYGLPFEWDLVASLVASPEAQRQVRDYGAVMTAVEEADWVEKRDISAAISNVVDRIYTLDGYVATEYLESDSGRGEVVIMMKEGTEQSVESDEAELRAAGFEVKIVTTAFSTDELQQIARSLDPGAEDTPELRAAIPAELRDRYDDARSALQTLGIQSTSISVAGQDDPDLGYVLALVDSDTDVGTVIEMPEGYPPVRVARPIESDPAGSPCSRWGCGPVRGGMHIERDGSNARCTMGFAVKDGSDESWLTAGHCWKGQKTDVQRYNWPSVNSTWFAYTNLTPNMPDLDLGSEGNNSFYNLTKYDGKEIRSPDYLVSNLVRRDGSNNGIHITQSGAVFINMQVCYFGVSSGTKCGKINNVSATVTLSGSGFQITDSFKLDVAAAVGDSGAPVVKKFSNNYAVGTIFSVGASASKITNLGTVDPGMTVYTTNDYRKDFILGMYQVALNRFADPSGYNGWRYGIMGSCTVAKARQTAEGIFLSTEFTLLHPMNQFDGAKKRVELAYHGILGRASDPAGLAGWAAGLDAGTTWDAVVLSFTGSQEFTDRVSNGATAYDGRIC